MWGGSSDPPWVAGWRTRPTFRAMAVILIVEDDPHVARLIGFVLQRGGHTSEGVGDGDLAVEKARQLLPAMIFADLGIKGLSGEALCSALKRDEATRGIPYVIVSGDRDLAEKARGCGA